MAQPDIAPEKLTMNPYPSRPLNGAGVDFNRAHNGLDNQVVRAGDGPQRKVAREMRGFLEKSNKKERQFDPEAPYQDDGEADLDPDGIEADPVSKPSRKLPEELVWSHPRTRALYGDYEQDNATDATQFLHRVLSNTAGWEKDGAKVIKAEKQLMKIFDKAKPTTVLTKDIQDLVHQAILGGKEALGVVQEVREAAELYQHNQTNRAEGYDKAVFGMALERKRQEFEDEEEMMKDVQATQWQNKLHRGPYLVDTSTVKDYVEGTKGAGMEWRNGGVLGSIMANDEPLSFYDRDAKSATIETNSHSSWDTMEKGFERPEKMRRREVENEADDAMRKRHKKANGCSKGATQTEVEFDDIFYYKAGLRALNEKIGMKRHTSGHGDLEGSASYSGAPGLTNGYGATDTPSQDEEVDDAGFDVAAHIKQWRLNHLFKANRMGEDKRTSDADGEAKILAQTKPGVVAKAKQAKRKREREWLAKKAVDRKRQQQEDEIVEAEFVEAEFVEAESVEADHGQIEDEGGNEDEHERGEIEDDGGEEMAVVVNGAAS